MMSEAEEAAWAKKRYAGFTLCLSGQTCSHTLGLAYPYSTLYRSEDQLIEDAPLLLPPSSPQSAQISNVTARLIQALLSSPSSPSDNIVSFSGWWKDSQSSTDSPQEDDRHQKLQVWGPGAEGDSEFYRERQVRANREGDPAWKRTRERERGRRDFRLTKEEEVNVINIKGWRVYVVDKVRRNSTFL